MHLPAVKKSIKEGSEEELSPALQRGTGKVMILDDDSMIRQITGDMLRALGYKVDFAKSGEELLEKHQQSLRKKSPCSTIIMDLTLEHGLSAKETIKRLREIDQDVPVIVSSGYSNDPMMNRYHQYGFNGCVIKPYDMQQLGHIIEAVSKE